jgi:putative hydrolase of the HAD superfamily
MLDAIGFDADDTLWNNETLYTEAKEEFARALSPYSTPDQARRRLDEIELNNLDDYGYGIKSFALSMVEAAVDISGGRVTGEEVEHILGIVRAMLSADVRLFPHAESTLAALAATHRLMLITKGDLFEQARKVRRSGLAPYFWAVEIVGDKSAEAYLALLDKYAITPERFLMVGNSIRSDIAPVLEIGGKAVYVPYAETWSHENEGLDALAPGSYYEVEHLGQLPALVAVLDAEP